MSWHDLPKGRFDGGDDAVDKAIAMLKQGKSEAFVSDYLGMCPRQVASTNRNMRLRNGQIGRPQTYNATGCNDLEESVWNFRAAARQGSEALLEAMRRAM